MTQPYRPGDPSDEPPPSLGAEERKLQRALRPIVESTLTETLERNQERMAESLYPVIGRAVRKSVREALRGFAESINRTMESALTLRFLRWRWEAWRSGKPVSEIVLRHSLLYRVEEVFLIHERTGLLIQHVAHGHEVKDRDLVSAMLQAIQDFVRDSFQPGFGEHRLEGFETDDLDVWLSHGPMAYLAVVIRGEPPYELRDRFHQVIEDVHRDFFGELARFDGDGSPLAGTKDYLEECLLSEQRERPRKKKPFFTLFVFALLGALAWGGYHWSKRLRERKDMAKELAETPGIVVLKSPGAWGKAEFSILRDPRARSAREILRIPESGALLEETPFVSRDATLLVDVAERACGSFTTEADRVRWDVRGSTLFAQGEASAAWLRQAQIGTRSAGLEGVDLSQVSNRDLRPCMETAKEIVGVAIAFEPSQLTIPATEAGKWNRLAKLLRDFTAQAAKAEVSDLVELYAVPPNDPPVEADIQMARQRAERARAKLAEAGLDLARLVARDVAPPTLVRQFSGGEGNARAPRVILVPACLISSSP